MLLGKKKSKQGRRPPQALNASFGVDCAMASFDDSEYMSATMIKQPSRDPLLQLVSLQKASGCWVLDPALAAALGKTSDEVEKPKPASVKQEVWAT
ncbi:von Willebrand factor A domain-containing protein 5A-like, partial [Lates japonicus]